MDEFDFKSKPTPAEIAAALLHLHYGLGREQITRVLNISERHGFRIMNVIEQTTDTLVSRLTPMSVVNGVQPGALSITKNIKKDSSSSGDEQFNHFWSLWPRKDNKKGAARSFAKLSRKKQLDCIAGVPKYVAYVQSLDWKQDWMLPTTWIRNERWDDTFSVDEKPKSAFGGRRPNGAFG